MRPGKGMVKKQCKAGDGVLPGERRAHRYIYFWGEGLLFFFFFVKQLRQLAGSCEDILPLVGQLRATSILLLKNRGR